MKTSAIILLSLVAGIHSANLWQKEWQSEYRPADYQGHPLNFQGSFFKDGQEYEFETIMSQLAGTMDVAPFSSGEQYKMKWRIQKAGNTFNCHMKDIKNSIYNGRGIWNQQLYNGKNPFEETHFTQWAEDVKFKIEFDANGKFKSLTVPAGKTYQYKNFCRAMANILQQNIQPWNEKKEMYYKSTEKTLYGECDVEYTLSDHMMLKTTVHMRDCKKRTFFRFIDQHQGFRCDLDMHKEYPFQKESTDGLYSQGNTMFKADDNGEIIYFQSTGQLVAQMYEAEGMRQFTHANVTAVLTKKGASSGDISVAGDTIDDLEYEFQDKEYKWNKERDLKAVEPFFGAQKEKLFDASQSQLKTMMMKSLDMMLERMGAQYHHDNWRYNKTDDQQNQDHDERAPMEIIATQQDFMNYIDHMNNKQWSWGLEWRNYVKVMGEKKNDKPYWTTPCGNYSLWWKANRWYFGFTTDLGTDKAETRSYKMTEFKYPYEIREWEYFTQDKQWKFIGQNIQVQSVPRWDHDDITVQNNHKKGMESLYFIMYSMDYKTMKQIFEELSGDKTEYGIKKFNMYNEYLANTGTTASAMLIMDMVKNNKFNDDRDAARVLTAVPFQIRRPNKQLVQEYEKLLNWGGAKRFVKMAIPMTFGHLVRKTCELAGPIGETEQVACWKNFAPKYVKMFFEKFTAAADRDEKQVWLNGMANIRYGGQMKLLKDIIYGKTKETTEIRSYAVWAAGYDAMMSGKLREFMFPIFANQEDDHEVRIYAFCWLMWKPSVNDFSRVMAILKNEKNYEVLNYAYTYFEKMANSLLHCEKETRDTARFFLKFMKQWSGYKRMYEFGVSKLWSREYNKEKYGYAGRYNHMVVGSHQSTTPLVIAMNSESEFFQNYQRENWGVYIRLEGLAKGIIRKFKTLDPSKWKIADLKKILGNEMAIRERPDQPIRVKIMFYLKGVHVFSRSYDEKDVKSGGKLHQMFMDFMGLGDNYQLNHYRMLKFGGIMYEQPSQIGLPLAYMDSTTISGHFKANIKRQNNFKMQQGQFNFRREMDYMIDLKGHAQSGMFFANPDMKMIFGIVQSRIHHGHDDRKVAFGFDWPKKEIKFEISRPKYDNPMMVFMHAQTYVAVWGQEINEQGEPKVPELYKHCPHCDRFEVVTRGQMRDQTWNQNRFEQKWDKRWDHQQWNQMEQMDRMDQKMYQRWDQKWDQRSQMYGQQMHGSWKQGRTDRNIWNVEDKKYGYYSKAEYFDCEMDISMMNVRGRGLGAFAPINKYPVNRFTSLTMGLRQIWAFVSMYPRVEKCGFYGVWSQSKYNPTTKYEITLNGKTRQTEGVLFMKGRNVWFEGFLKAHAEPQEYERHYKMSVFMDNKLVPGDREFKIRGEFMRLPNAKIGLTPYTICAKYMAQSPAFPKDKMTFHEYENFYIRGKAMVQYGPHTECDRGDGEINMDFKHETTYEAMKTLQNKWYFRKCMQQLNQTEWQYRKTATYGSQMLLPITWDCVRVIRDAATLRHYSWNIQFTKMSDRFRRFVGAFKNIVQAGMMPFWDVNPYYVDNEMSSLQSPYMKIETWFKNYDQKMDMRMETSQGVNEIKDFSLPFNWQQVAFPFSLRSGGNSNWLMDYLFYDSKIMGVCMANPFNIHTNDNVTYPYTLGKCWTLLSADCGPHPSYAAFAKKVGNKMAMKIYFGGHYIDITENKDVSVNGSPIPVHNDKDEYVHTHAGEDIFKVYRWGHHISVFAWKSAWVNFDGHYTSVTPWPSVRGQHCGMCGNFNRNQFDEWTGKDYEKMIDSSKAMVEEWKWKC